MTYWNKEITIYNRHEDSNNAVKYYRHNLKDCFFKRTNQKVMIGNTLLESNENIVRIPQQKNYLSPWEWGKVDNKSDYLTIQPKDIIVFGNVADEIDEYSQGQRASDLIAKYKALGTVFVRSVNDNTMLPIPHYCVKGE